jgi:hypothetical protein
MLHLIDYDEVESIHTALQIQHMESTFMQNLEREEASEEPPALDMSSSNESDDALVNPQDDPALVNPQNESENLDVSCHEELDLE